MRSYIKIYGPPTLEAIRALEKIALEMPEVCIMDTIIAQELPMFSSETGVAAYFGTTLGIEVPVERCGKLISKSGELLGEYDFFFEWFKEPTMDELNRLIQKIDEALAPLGCKYTITTKK
ncbi:MAG: hypothetical protein QW486_04635 [Candidatus Bathyarchaeia archaeon]|nr:hypothetical protein [Candidatus Bathyarchaeota archaeon]